MERDSIGRFVKGRIETLEENRKRREGLKKSWLKRSDYIGDIVNENPYIYNSWRGIRFSERGKKVGNSNEWNDFRTFYNDVSVTYQKGYILTRKNMTLPFSKDNFMWVSRSEFATLNNKKPIFLTFNNKTLTIDEWSHEVGISASAIKRRYYKHKDKYTVEEVIYGKKIKRNTKTPKHWSDEEKSNIRKKASKMMSSYKIKDKQRNMESCDFDIEWFIANIILKPCIYCGDTKRVGADRIDNNKGHLKSNIIPCCYDCNCARNRNFTYEEMKIIGESIKRVKENRIEIK